ncbi:MAG: hypothetical protein KC502_04380 [Myxococcales bacterium]|nr:hypothetical protein [Myxococcales bacterium]
MRAMIQTLCCLALTLLIAAPALAGTPSVMGTQPPNQGQLVGNSVMFVGYDLMVRGKAPEATVVDETLGKPVAVKVNAKCAKPRSKGARGRCFVEVRLLRWQTDHRYRATVHGHTIQFTVVKGHPGDKRPGQ